MKGKKGKEDIVRLTKEEVEKAKQFQDALEKEKTNLGSLRLQLLLSERRIIANVEKAQNEFFSYLQTLSQNKGITSDGDWFFDPTAYVFRKKT